MSSIDVPQTLAWLYELNGYLDSNRRAHNDDDRESDRSTAAEIHKRLIALRRIAERIAPDRASAVDERGMSYTWFWGPVSALVTQLIGALEQDERLEKMLAPVGPSIAASQLHPLVWRASAQLWDDGHRRAALQHAATAVETQLKAKVGRYDTDVHPLLDQSFSTNPPTPEQPRLRFTRFIEGSDTWRNAHLGAKDFGRGCISAIRNVITHETDEPEEQVALEQLAALSVLARWIDDAGVAAA